MLFCFADLGYGGLGSTSSTMEGYLLLWSKFLLLTELSNEQIEGAENCNF